MIKNYLNSKSLSSINGIEHYFGKRDFIFPNLEKVYFLNQLHSDKVIFVSDDFDWNEQKDGDAIITSKRNLFIGVRTADCVPILLSDESSSFIAVVHAGWRGTFYNIVNKTIERILNEFNCNPEDIIAALGPSIGGCCYEVGKPLWNKFNHEHILFPDDFSQIGEKYYLNLQSINRNFLKNSGVQQIDLLAKCTKCEDDFYSYRRDKSKKNSQISIIKLN